MSFNLYIKDGEKFNKGVKEEFNLKKCIVNNLVLHSIIAKQNVITIRRSKSSLSINALNDDTSIITFIPDNITDMFGTMNLLNMITQDAYEFTDNEKEKLFSDSWVKYDFDYSKDKRIDGPILYAFKMTDKLPGIGKYINNSENPMEFIMKAIDDYENDNSSELVFNRNSIGKSVLQSCRDYATVYCNYITERRSYDDIPNKDLIYKLSIIMVNDQLHNKESFHYMNSNGNNIRRSIDFLTASILHPQYSKISGSLDSEKEASIKLFNENLIIENEMRNNCAFYGNILKAAIIGFIRDNHFLYYSNQLKMMNDDKNMDTFNKHVYKNLLSILVHSAIRFTYILTEYMKDNFGYNIYVKKLYEQCMYRMNSCIEELVRKELDDNA